MEKSAFYKELQEKLQQIKPDLQFVLAEESLSFSKTGERKMLSVPLQDYYADYQSGVKFSDITIGICQKITEILEFELDFSQISDYRWAKNHIFCKVQHADRYKAYSAKMPFHQLSGDMVMTYHILIDGKENNENSAALLITSQLLNSFGITEEQLHNDALMNSSEIFAPELSKLNDVIKKMYPETKTKVIPLDAQEIFILTNKTHEYGAAVLFYPSMMKKMAAFLGGSYFVFPSSVHELMLLADKKEWRDLQHWNAVIREVNQTVISKKDFLSNHLYYYDADTNRLELAADCRKLWV